MQVHMVIHFEMGPMGYLQGLIDHVNDKWAGLNKLGQNRLKVVHIIHFGTTRLHRPHNNLIRSMVDMDLHNLSICQI